MVESVAISMLRQRIERTIDTPLPVDQDVLDYLVRVADAAEDEELFDLVGDFCPKLSSAAKTSVVNSLKEHSSSASSSTAPDAKATGPKAPMRNVTAAAQQEADDEALARQLAADFVLAQMLQEEEAGALDLGSGPQGRGRGKKGKKANFRPLNIQYTVGHHATAAQIGSAAPSSLADMLRSRRAQQMQQVPGRMGAAFGPPAVRNAPTEPRIPADLAGGLTWAERARVADTQAAAAAAEPAQEAPVQHAYPAPVSTAAPTGSSSSSNLRILMDSGNEYTMSSAECETIGDLKLRFEKLHGVPFGRQRLLSMGRELLDSQHIKALGLRSGQPLHLALRNATAEMPLPQPRAKAAPVVRSTSPSSTVSVNLRLPNGRSGALEVLDSGTIADLKEEVQRKYGIPAICQIVSFSGRGLPDEGTLADCGVASGATLDVDLPPPGLAAEEGAQGHTAQPKGKKQDSAASQAAAAPVVTTSPARQQLIRQVFDLCDADGDGLLKDQEMRQAALHSGWEGSVDEWAQEYVDLCRDSKCDPAVGVDLQSFHRLLDDQSESGIYLNDEELRAMIHRLGKERQVRQPPAKAKASPPADPNRQSTAQAPPAAKQPPPAAKQPAARPASQQASAPVPKAKPQEAAPDPTKDPKRAQVIHEVFELLDADRSGTLNESEMRRFAELTGFEGSAADWTEEYQTLCEEKNVCAKRGFDEAFFREIVNDDSDTGQFCELQELKTMQVQLLAESQKASASAAAPAETRAPSTAAPVSAAKDRSSRPRTRDDMIRAAFTACDSNGDGYLCRQEMLQFARHAAFDGTDSEWASEFDSICSENLCGPKGVDMKTFAKLVDDNSDDGCYVSESELLDMIQKMYPQVLERIQKRRQAKRSAHAAVDDDRGELIWTAFKACDQDGDGLLNVWEMRSFAEFLGFQGDFSDWSRAYECLLSDAGVLESLDGLIDYMTFTELVNDSSARGCYCTNDDLREFVIRLRPDTLARSLFETLDVDSACILSNRVLVSFLNWLRFGNSSVADQMGELLARHSDGLRLEAFVEFFAANPDSNTSLLERALRWAKGSGEDDKPNLVNVPLPPGLASS